MVTTFRLPIFFLAILGAGGINAAADGPEPPTTPVSVAPPAPAEEGLSLPLYRELREQLEHFSATTEDSASGEEPPTVSKTETAARLRALTSANFARLLRALTASQSIQREVAARALAFTSHAGLAAPPLCAVLRHDTEVSVRQAAASALAYLGDASATDTLLAGLSDSDDTVRAICALALGRTRDERAVPALLLVLERESTPQVRLQAAVALGRIGSGVDVKALAALLRDERDERVRVALAATLRVLTGTDDKSLAEMPDTDEFSQRLATLSGDMQRVERKLREDRHDEVVQLDQRDVDQKISDLISELEKAQSTAQALGQESKERSRRRLSALEQQGLTGASSSTPRPDKGAASALSGNRVNPGEVAAQYDPWSTLPPKEHDELLQAYRPEVPLRWRKRLEAYFVSIAVDEAARSSR